MRGYNVLSLFGGIETGYAALVDAGVQIENYYSSEIDKNAMKVTSVKYPKVVHLGDVVKFARYFCASAANLEKIKQYQHVTAKTLRTIAQVEEMKAKGVDLCIGGSPCQGFSFAGKQLNFKDPRSVLFFTYVRILEECKRINADVYFVLENVPMVKKSERVINEIIGILPWKNNAALVSAQNRKRLWWSNIRTKRVGLFGDLVTDFPQPEDMGIMLADILEPEVHEKYFLSSQRVSSMMKRVGKYTQVDGEKSMCFTTRSDAGWQGEMITVKTDINGQPKANQDKSGCFTAGGNSGGNSGGNHSDMDLIWQTARGNNPGGECAQNGKTPCVSASRWEQNNHVICLNNKRTEYGKSVRKDYEAGKVECKRSEVSSPQPRDDGKTGTITTVEKDNTLQVGTRLRRLTPVEVCRLFTLPDDLFKDENGRPIIAESNQYKALGNGWVIKVVSHIFSFLPELQ